MPKRSGDLFSRLVYIVHIFSFSFSCFLPRRALSPYSFQITTRSLGTTLSFFLRTCYSHSGALNRSRSGLFRVISLLIILRKYKQQNTLNTAQRFKSRSIYICTIYLQFINVYGEYKSTVMVLHECEVCKRNSRVIWFDSPTTSGTSFEVPCAISIFASRTCSKGGGQRGITLE